MIQVRAPAVPALALALALGMGHGSQAAQAVPGESPADVTPALPRPSVSPQQGRALQPGLAPDPEPALQAELARLRAAVRANGGRQAGRAAWQLGLAALHGVGGPVAPAQARTWFARAQRLGEPLAAAGLAWCAMDGCSGPPDPAQARRWIAALRPHDGARASYLDWLLASERAPLSVLPASPLSGPQAAPAQRQMPSTARLLGELEAAARAGSVHAQLELGLAAAAQGNEREALARFQAAAPRSRAAAANLALLSQRRQAPAASGPGQAAFEQAQRAHRGIGQPANFGEAVRLYRQAQQEGSAPAGRMLALIFSRAGPDGGLDVGWMQQLAQVDVTRTVPAIDPSAVHGMLQREPTALSDLLPERWSAAASVQR